MPQPEMRLAAYNITIAMNTNIQIGDNSVVVTVNYRFNPSRSYPP